MSSAMERVLILATVISIARFTVPADAAGVDVAVRWTFRNPTASPSARAGSAAAPDSSDGNVVLFGGYDGGDLGDTWTWDGTSWTRRTPATSPSARDAASIANDPHSGHVVLFGGQVVTPRQHLQDTWIWGGTTWTPLSLTTKPLARAAAAMASDPASGRIVLFGGEATDRAILIDTWTFDGSSWTLQHPSVSPPPREKAAMATDPTTGHVVLFGGSDANGVLLGDTWTWDGSNWAHQSPLTSPTRREGATMATDAASGHVVLFGGSGPNGSLLAGTWTWDGTNWAKAFPPTSPMPRRFPAMASDPAGRLVLFGGVQGESTGFLNDTWSLTPSLTITPGSGPSGTVVNVRGFGYAPGSTINVVKYRTSQAPPPQGPYGALCSASVAGDTTFACSGAIPTGDLAGAPGRHDIVAKDSTGLKSATTFNLTG